MNRNNRYDDVKVLVIRIKPRVNNTQLTKDSSHHTAAKCKISNIPSEISYSTLSTHNFELLLPRSTS